MRLVLVPALDDAKRVAASTTCPTSRSFLCSISTLRDRVQRLSPPSGSETKGERWRGDGRKGRRVGIELQRSERLLCFSRKFTVLDLVKLKASPRIPERLYTFYKTRLGP